MTYYDFKTFCRLAVIFASLLFGESLMAQPRQQQIEVAMRTIGHKVLLSTGDSTSRVLPVEHESNRYKISFATHLLFNPFDMANAIDEVLRSGRLSETYSVEVAQCSSGEVVYSYGISAQIGTSQIPCATRIPPPDCYLLYITLHDALPAEVISNASLPSYWIIALGLIATGGIGGLMLYRTRRREASATNDHMVRIGKYTVDRRNMELRCGETRQTLTGKETELLLLLQSAVNSTVQREAILHAVWGDEGDYVGRTLDVFISKLRKKLEADPGVRIANIRGVGYKLVVVDEASYAG